MLGIETNKIYRCIYCDEKFKTDKKLLEHVRAHHVFEVQDIWITILSLSEVEIKERIVDWRAFDKNFQYVQLLKMEK